MKSSISRTSQGGMIIIARFSRESGQATPINRDKLWPLKNNYNHMKSSMTYPSHGGMIIVARFHSLPRLIGVTTKRQL